MKRFLASALVLAFTALPVMADTEVNVTVNGNPVEQKGVILEDRTMVPVRGVTEQLGYTADWDADTKTATITDGTNTIVMTAGEAVFYVNDEPVTPDVPQTIIDGRFMLPLRAMCESVGAEVEWDGQTKTAAITQTTEETETVTGPTEETPETPLDASDIEEKYADAINEIVI